MSIFQAIILVLFTTSLVYKFVYAIYRHCPLLTVWYGFEMVAFGYLARTLM